MDFNFTTGEQLFQTLLLVCLALFTLILLVAVVNVYIMARKVLDAKLGIVRESSNLSIWDRINNLRPLKEEQQIMLDHDYDGIKELDNHLPPWWLGMFYGGIIFAVIYLLNYHVWHWSPTQSEEYEIAMAEAADIKKANLANEENAIDENSVVMTDDVAALAQGEAIYTGNCVACHGTMGEGGVGPNLTDEYWIHGGSISSVFKTIKYGVAEKGMIPWEGSLTPAQMQNVSSYVLTLVGTNPPNGKAPQGELYVPEEIQEEVIEETSTEVALAE